MIKKYLSHNEVSELVFYCSQTLGSLTSFVKPVKIWPVPRGGVPVAYALSKHMPNVLIVDSPHDADVILDDIVDSGITKLRYNTEYPNATFYALIDKQLECEFKDMWVVFPWEKDDDTSSVSDNIVRLLQYIGEDPTRQGLLETPKRVIKAWEFKTSGYNKNPVDVLKCFEDGAESCDQMVVRRGIPFYSQCVVGSTFVETPRGRVPISRLKDGDLIYTMDPKTFELTIVKCSNPRVTRKNANLVQVHTDNDSLICTPDHKILLTSGEWVEAKDLKSNDRIASLYRGFQGGTNKEQYDKAYPVLIASRYTRHDSGLKLNGESIAVLEHRFVKNWAEPGCYPKGKKLVTHHIDETTWNNLPENLQVLTQKEHNAEHNHGARLAHNEERRLNSAKSSSREDVRQKRSESVRLYWERIKADPDAYNERCIKTSEGIQAARNHTVFGVEHLEYTEDVWCMTVPNTHLFFANGMAVHNCEHHLEPIIGHCTIAYIPKGKIVGLSKMDRLCEIFARRLQVQERMTNQIADAMFENLKPLGVGVWISARHLCVESRGVCNTNSETITQALRGNFLSDPTVRAEFMGLCK